MQTDSAAMTGAAGDRVGAGLVLPVVIVAGTVEIAVSSSVSTGVSGSDARTDAVGIVVGVAVEVAVAAIMEIPDPPPPPPPPPEPVKEKITITLNVQFDTAKAVVKEKYYDDIKRVADFMKEYPNTKAVIEGHTDSVASDAYNLRLSNDRANSVRQYLIKEFVSRLLVLLPEVMANPGR